MSEPCHRCERFRVELADCKTLASAVIEQLTTERDELLDAIVRVKTIVDDPNAALVASLVRAALNAPTASPPELEREGDAPTPMTFPSLERGYGRTFHGNSVTG